MCPNGRSSWHVDIKLRSSGYLIYIFLSRASRIVALWDNFDAILRSNEKRNGYQPCKKWAWNGRKRESDTSRLENMSPFYPETLKGYFLLQVSEVVLNFFSASFQTILNNGRRSSAPVTIPREESKLFMFTNARSLLSRYQINDWRYYIPAFVSTFFPNHFFNFKFNFSLNPTLYDLLTILCMILYRLAQQ